MKKLAIIGSVGLPANYGGFETLTNHLVLRLNKKFDITVFCSSKRYEEQLDEFQGAKLEYVNLDANGIQSIPYDMISLMRSVFVYDVVLVLGVSGSLILPFIKSFSKAKICVHVDGLEWKRAKWNWAIRKFLKFCEFIAVKYADEVVSDNKAIYEYISTTYGRDSSLIEYGGDHVVFDADNSVSSVLEEYNLIKQNYAFSVCRIVPENNIGMILEAFSRTDVNIVFVGNWKESSYGRKLMTQYSNNENINLLNPVYDQKSLDELRNNAKIYVHGHSAGGTNPSLVEAMYLGLPIIAYDVIYNRQTMGNSGVFFSNIEQLLRLLTVEQNHSAEGKKLKTIANKKYLWDSIAIKYEALISRAS